MNEIELTPLGKFRKKTVITTIALVVLTVLLVIVASSAQADAQSNYSEYQRITTEYEYIDGDEYLDKYNSATSTVTVCTSAAILSISAAVVSAIAWVGTNLLIANKRTVFASQKAIDKPMELDGYIDAVQAPIGSEVSFKEAGDSLIVTNLNGEPIGALNKEFSDRIKAADQNDTAKAFIISYHDDHPVIEITANA